MNIIDLPDDILLAIFNKYLTLIDLITVYQTCDRFMQIINQYNVWLNLSSTCPLLDFSYPNGENFILTINLNAQKIITFIITIY